MLNLNKTYYLCKTEISLLNIALISNSWKLENTSYRKHDVTLHSDEYEFLVLKAKRDINGENNYSEQSISNIDDNIKYPKVAYIDFAKRCDKFRINAFEEIETKEERSMKKEGHFLVRWQGKVFDNEVKRLVYGQSAVPIQPFDDVNEDEEQFASYTTRSTIDLIKSANLGNLAVKNADVQISCTALHPSLVKHNFSEKKMCVIKIKLQLHNICDFTTVVTVQTLDIHR